MGEFQFAQYGNSSVLDEIQELLEASVKASCEGLINTSLEQFLDLIKNTRVAILRKLELPLNRLEAFMHLSQLFAESLFLSSPS
jgi:hypothetical protein